MKITKSQLKRLIKEELEGKRMVYVVFALDGDGFFGAGERSIDAIFDSREKAEAYIEDYYPSERDREVHTSQIIEEHELE